MLASKLEPLLLELDEELEEELDDEDDELEDELDLPKSYDEPPLSLELQAESSVVNAKKPMPRYDVRENRKFKIVIMAPKLV
jgi:hypothetical protein